jgi:hypothetical protein
MGSSESYLGNIIGMGMTTGGDFFAIYGMFGEGIEDEQPKLIIEKNGISIGKYPENVDRDEMHSPHHVIMTHSGRDDFAVVGNGPHIREIDKIAKRGGRSVISDIAIKNALRSVSDDPGHMPAMAGILKPYNNMFPGILGMNIRPNAEVEFIRLEKGEIKYISITGHDDIALPDHMEIIGDHVSGNNARELADELYDFMGMGMGNALCAGATFTDKKGEFSFAVKNRGPDKI